MTVVGVTPRPRTPVGVSPTGAPGKGWIFDHGAPAANRGRVGDMYMNVDTFEVYGPKVSGATWVGAPVVNLKVQADLAIAARDAAIAAADAANDNAAASAASATSAWVAMFSALQARDEALPAATAASASKTAAAASATAAAASAATATTKAGEASTSATAAAASQTAAATSATNAASSATAASGSASAASGSASAAASSATAASSSASSASTSATNAGNSATAAAGSAAAAAATAASLGAISTAAYATLDTDTALAANSDTKVASQKAAKTYADTKIAASALDTDATLAANSSSKVPSQSAVKAYIDNAIAGVKWKDSVRAATTANGTLASAFANGQAVDGVTLVTGDRILLKNQSAGAENGIYVVNASGAPTRATQADTGAEIKQAAVFVEEGSTNADTGWVLTNNGTITLGSTALTFVQFSGAGAYSATGGLGLSGTQFSITDTILNAFRGLSAAANKIAYFTSSTAMTLADVSSAGLAMLSAASATAQTALLNAFTGDSGSGGVKGMVPAPGAGDAAAGKYLKADGSWAAPSSSGGSVPINSQFNAYTVVAGDKGKLIECTATLTLSLTAAATLGANFMFFVRMSANAGVVTIDPNSTEQIDGRNTVTGFIGDGIFMVVCDGTAWRTSRIKGAVLVSKITIASAVAAVDFESAWNDTEIAAHQFKHWGLSGASDAYIWLRLKQAGTYTDTALSGHRVDYASGASSQSVTNVAAAAELRISPQVGTGSNYSESGFFEVSGINEATRRVGSIIGQTQVIASSDDGYANAGRGCDFTAGQGSAGIIKGIRVMMSTGNISAGTIYQYAVRS